MWSDEINDILSHEKNFLGCYALDDLTLAPSCSLNSSIIVNTSYSYERGDHWVAIVMKQKKCFYFDSFGLPILSKEIMNFLSPFQKVTYSNVCIQNVNSDYCGQFCIAFIKFVKDKKSYKDFLFKFDHVNLSKNDNKVERIITKYNLSAMSIKNKIEEMKKAPTSVLIPSSYLRNQKYFQLGRGMKKNYHKRNRNSFKSKLKKKLLKRRKRKIKHRQRRRKRISIPKSI